MSKMSSRYAQTLHPSMTQANDNRYNSHLTQRESRSSLFSNYDDHPSSQSPGGGRPGSGYGNRYGADSSPAQGASGAFSAYPNGGASPSGNQQFRAATPNSRGQYSDAVLSELESQNDDHVSGILGKVGKLKEVRPNNAKCSICCLYFVFEGVPPSHLGSLFSSSLPSMRTDQLFIYIRVANLEMWDGNPMTKRKREHSFEV